MNDSNSTYQLEPQCPETFMRIFFADITTWNFVVYLLISVTGTLANVLLILAFFKDPLKCYHDATSCFIINLSLSDLLNLLFSMEELILSRTQYGSIYGLPPLISTINWAIFEFAAFLTFPSTFVLALERSLAIIYPLWHKVHITPSTCYIWLTIVWLFCCVFAGVQFTLVYKDQLYITKYSLMLPSAFFSVLTLIFYCISCMSIQKQRLATRNENSISEIYRHSIEARLRTQNQFLFTVFIINTGLISALVPTIVITYYIDGNSEIIDKPSTVLVGLFHAVDILLHFNFGANPFIYIWRLQKYRKTFFAMYWRRSIRNRTI